MEPLSIALIGVAATVAYDVTKNLVVKQTRMVKKRREAVSALSLAVTSTKSYLDYLRDGGQKSEPQQRHLSRLWEEAYFSLRPFFRDEPGKVEPLRLKAAYWENPKKWKSEDIKRTGIALARVQAKLKKWISEERVR